MELCPPAPLFCPATITSMHLRSIIICAQPVFLKTVLAEIQSWFTLNVVSTSILGRARDLPLAFSQQLHDLEILRSLLLFHFWHCKLLLKHLVLQASLSMHNFFKPIHLVLQSFAAKSMTFPLVFSGIFLFTFSCQ